MKPTGPYKKQCLKIFAILLLAISSAVSSNRLIAQDLSLQLEDYPLELFSEIQLKLRFQYEVNYELFPRNPQLSATLIGERKILQLNWLEATLPPPFQLTVTEKTPKGTRTHSFVIHVKKNADFKEGESLRTIRFSSDDDLKSEIAKSAARKKPAVAVADKPAPAVKTPSNPSNDKPAVKSPVANPPAAATSAEMDAVIAQADGFFQVGEFEKALPLYKQAQKARPTDSRIAERLRTINNYLEEQARKKAEDDLKKAELVRTVQEKENKYNEEMAKADKYLREKNFLLAKLYYRQALQFKADDVQANQRIKEVEAIEAQQRELDNKFNENMNYANRAYANGDLDVAIQWYEQALLVRPDDKALQTQLAKVQQEKIKRAEDEANRVKQAEARRAEAEFYGFLGAADNALKAKDFDKAEAQVLLALEKKPNDPAAMRKAEEINTARKREAERLLQTEASRKEAEFNGFLAAADLAIRNKDFDKADAQVLLALEKKPNDPAAMRKIEEINAARKREADRLVQAENEQVNREYNALLGRANASMAANKLDEAEKLYETARNSRPTDPYPTQQLDKIQQRRTQLELQITKAKEAKRIDSLNKVFNALVAEGDKAMKAGDLDKAELVFGQALMLKPEESKPQIQLQLIQDRRTAMAAKLEADKKRQEEERLNTEAYNAAMARGDNALEQKMFTEAIAAYNEAKGLKPSDANAKIKAANAQKALDEALELERLAREKAQRDRYDSLVALGNQAMLDKQYEASIKLYADAYDIFPDQAYPQKQINHVRKQMAIRDSLQKIEDDKVMYALLIKAADSAVLERNFDEARKLYVKAGDLQPTENYPISQVKIIDDPRQRVRLERKGDYVRFDKWMDEGILLSEQKKYEEAKQLFENALKIKPQDFRAQFEYNKVVTLMNGGVPPPVTPAAAVVAKTEPAPAAATAAKNEVVQTGAFTDTEPGKTTEAPAPKPEISEVAAPVVLVKQLESQPINAAQMAERFGGIDLNSNPPGQKFTTDYYRPEDTLSNYKLSMQVLSSASNTNIIDSIEADKIGATLDLISFGSQNVYLRVNIRNYGTSEFVAGDMLLNFEKADGTQVPYAPCYITGFPVVLPGHHYSFVFVARIGSPANNERFILSISERLKKTKLNFSMRGELYNNILDNSNQP